MNVFIVDLVATYYVPLVKTIRMIMIELPMFSYKVSYERYSVLKESKQSFYSMKNALVITPQRKTANAFRFL